MSTTWVQRNVSPVASRLFAVGFISRKVLLWGILQTSRFLDLREKAALRFSLIKFGIIQPQFHTLKLSEIEEYHLSKVVTNKKMIFAADNFYKRTGRDVFLKTAPLVIKGRTTGEIDARRGTGVNYLELLKSSVLPHLGASLSQPAESISQHQQLVEEAFLFISRFSFTPKPDLVYRIRKMADIGGDIQTTLASLFLDVPLEELTPLLDTITDTSLIRFKSIIYNAVSRAKELKTSFEFDTSRLANDQKHLSNKMLGLIKESGSPQALLLFFFEHLIEIRKTASSSAKVYEEARLLYAPLADRVGLVYLADDFRDQLLRLKDPDKYAFVEQKAQQRIKMGYESAKVFLIYFTKELIKYFLKNIGPDFMGASIKFRVKSPFSIWNNVEHRHKHSYNELTDILGVKIIVPELLFERTFALLKNYRHLKFSDKDVKRVLAASKSDPTWRGIKIEAVDPAGIPIEIQIMTEEMNRENNSGKAATWKYNLDKELKPDGITQEFNIPEPPEVISSDYVSNFYQIYHLLPQS